MTSEAAMSLKDWIQKGRELGASDVAPRNLCMNGIDFERNHMPISRKRPAKPDCAISAKGADFQDTARADELRLGPLPRARRADEDEPHMSLRPRTRVTFPPPPERPS